MSSTVNGLTLLEAAITIPRVGVWHADLVVDTDDASKVTGAVAIDLVDGALTLTGTTWRDAVVWRGVTRARVAGGAAGLRTPLDAGSYWSTTVRTILLDILGAASERVSPTVLEELLDTAIDHWVRLAGSAGTALTDVADDLDLVWRVLLDGTVWMGAETWPDSGAAEYVIMERNIENAMMVLGVDRPTLIPGVIFEDQRVGRVVHRLGGDKIRTDVWFDDGA